MTFTRIGQTARMQAGANQNAAGSKPGETALETKPQNSSAIAAWLADKHPVDMDKAALSRALSHGVGLKVRYEGRFPSGPNGERLPSYDVAVGCDISDEGDRQAALTDLRNFMTPAPMRKIEEWIARLSVTCAKRRDDDFSEELRVVEYASRLSRYPADVVQNVLLHHSYQFFPTWAELEGRCEAMTSPRRQMIQALERGPEQKPEPRREPTAEEKARIQKLVDEMFPSRSKAEREAAVEKAMEGDCMTGGPMAGFAPQHMEAGE